MAEQRRIVYTAQAHVTGGRDDGHGRTSDGALDVRLHRPVEMGGDGRATNPEQLFAVGYAACFESSLARVARLRHMEPPEVAIDSKVFLMPAEDRRYELGVELDVTLPGIQDPAEAAELVRAAHERCPYSNATRGNIEVALIANGRPVDGAAGGASPA